MLESLAFAKIRRKPAKTASDAPESP